MKKFNCEVTRVDTYEITLDETVLDKEWMNHFKRYFYNIDDLQGHAENIAQFRARFGDRFIEGYGVPLVDGKVPYYANEKEVNKGISIRVISEDDDADVYSTEVQN